MIRGRRRRFLTVLFSAIIALSFAWIPQMEAASSGKPGIEDVEYEGNGRVELEFDQDVRFQNLKVTVRDSSGKRYKTRILQTGEDELCFSILNWAAGKTYTCIIEGVRGRSAKGNSWYSVSAAVQIPKKNTALSNDGIKDIEYDVEDQTLSFDFWYRVEFKSSVSVQISKGERIYKAVVDEKDSDGLEVSVSGLKEGKKYSCTIKGIRLKGASSYGSVSGTFVCRYD